MYILFFKVSEVSEITPTRPAVSSPFTVREPEAVSNADSGSKNNGLHEEPLDVNQFGLDKLTNSISELKGTCMLLNCRGDPHSPVKGEFML